MAISKHLCGAATDLALRGVTVDDVRLDVAGVALATCCHHRCDWAHYTGKPFFASLVRECVCVCVCIVYACLCIVSVHFFVQARRACFPTFCMCVQGLSPVDFERVRLLSSWATCGWGRGAVKPDDSGDEHDALAGEGEEEAAGPHTDTLTYAPPFLSTTGGFSLRVLFQCVCECMLLWRPCSRP